MSTIPSDVAEKITKAAYGHARAVGNALGLRPQDARIDDVKGYLACEGQSVFIDTGNVAFALRRMADRKKTELKRVQRELARPEVPMSMSDLALRAESTGADPHQVAAVMDQLDSYSTEERKIVTDIMAGKARAEIAKDLGISEDTLKRRLETLQRKERQVWNR